MMKLKDSLNGVVLGGGDTDKIFQALSVTLLDVAVDSDLGTHTSLNELNVLLHLARYNLTLHQAVPRSNRTMYYSKR